jgi:uncharacterized protein
MTPAMTSSTTALELVNSLYEAFGRGDIPFILSHIAPECRWVSPGAGIPYTGSYVGPAGAAEFFRRLAESEQITRFEPREFFVNGEDVVALGMEEGRPIATNKTAATNWAMLFRVRGGHVVYWESFFDTAAYAEAHKK